ncbi:MAG: putative lipid II flippase FtsW [Acidimicrobiia bacterium]|nr:putative lipid II flippase FtsW [Acidimicrobiia bacterium]
MTVTATSRRSRSSSGTGRSGRSGRSARTTRSTRSKASTRSTSSRKTGSSRAGDDRTERRQASRRHPSRRRRSGLEVTDLGRANSAFLVALFTSLTLFGLVMVLSASSVASLHLLGEESPFGLFRKQLIRAGIGTVGFLAGAHIDYRRIRRFAAPAMIGVLVLLVVVLLPGVGRTVNGSQRWIGVGGFVIQPSELAKLVFVIFTADLLARRERRMDRPELTVRPVMLTLCLLSGLIVLQPKLGTPLVLAAVACLMLFVAGARLPSLFAWAGGLAAGGLAMALAVSYQQDRLTSFLDPWKDPGGDGFQIIQSRVGIASGGVGGVGLGASRAKWGFLPESQTDFIFAIVAEEVGLIGASAVILAFVLVAFFGVRAALGAPDRFGMLLAAGITIWLVFQAFLNIGIVIGVLPTTGEPLPFLSYGGTSIIVTLTAAGLLTGVSRRAVDPTLAEGKP